MAQPQSIRFVLDALDFPAERWEIVTAAEFYGADAATCEWLRRLPLRAQPYRDIQDVIDALGEPIALPATRRRGGPRVHPTPGWLPG
ncbi:MAG TPA: DUF2795 domain-containing protein [Pseudonocardiaceae bacterium]|nr:DUF2795 domain-containing protein [Pseudonocardiaceae bacterium]